MPAAVADLRGQHVAAIAEGDVGAPAAAADGARDADLGGAIENGDRGAGIGAGNRAGDGPGRLVGAAPPGLVIATTGAVVSSVITSAAVVEVLPATSLNCAKICLVPSAPRSPAVTVRLTLPAGDLGGGNGVGHRMGQRAEPPSSNCTVSPAATVGLSAMAKLGDVTSVMPSVCDVPGIRGRREHRRAAARCRGIEGEAERGGTGVAEAIGLGPATMVWAPSESPLGVNDQAPCALVVTVVAMAPPSMVKCTTLLASPVPVSTSFEVMPSLAELPVSMVSASVSVGPVVLSV